MALWVRGLAAAGSTDSLFLAQYYAAWLHERCLRRGSVCWLTGRAGQLPHLQGLAQDGNAAPCREIVMNFKMMSGSIKTQV